METNEVNTDSEKRGKLLFLAGIITIAIFLTKILQGDAEMTPLHVYISGGIYFIFSFIGLLWAFNFQIKLKSLLFVFQSALFVFSEVVFVELFFFQKFNRIYEAIILLLLLVLIFVGNYVSFLMANVFNVNLFMRLPLAQVGRTSSYIISLLMMYFLTFSFLTSNFPLYLLIPLVIITYALITVIHYINMGIEEGELRRKTALTTLLTVFLFLGIFLSGSLHELSALVPALGYYLSVSMVTQEQVFRKNSVSWIFSLFILVIAFIAVVLLNIVNG